MPWYVYVAMVAMPGIPVAMLIANWIRNRPK